MPINNWRRPEVLLLAMAFVMPLTFSAWQALLNNFAIDMAGFTGQEIGILQSLREVPGFLAFTAVFVLLLMREQTFALLFLLIMCIGVAVTGLFPSALGLYATTVLMSVGFHYFETANQSLTLQLVAKDKTAHFLGQALAVKGAAALLCFGGIWLLSEHFAWSYQAIYGLAGGIGIAVVLALWLLFPQFKQHAEQRKTLVLRQRYWLYYALTFFSGARRQIFVVFAGFLLVQKFGYSVGQISLLYLVNHAINILFAPALGRLIKRLGERRALTVEYIGLALVFSGYAMVESPEVAAGLYVIDHLLFAMAIAIKTYFQKIADPKDIASTAAVSFTINHIAAVVLPVALGAVWLIAPSWVFMIGALLALCSLALARLVPQSPDAGNEVALPWTKRLGNRPGLSTKVE